MITMKNFLDTIKYRITDGGKYQWSCYGPNARMIDGADKSGYTDGWSASIVFDTETQEVYEASVYDYKNDRAYRLINPDYVTAHEEEAKSRGVDFQQAWDDIEYTDLDVDSDWLEKAAAIVAGEEYDERVVVSVDINSDILLRLMRAAHDQDMTFNDFIERAIKEYCEFV